MPNAARIYFDENTNKDKAAKGDEIRKITLLSTARFHGIYQPVQRDFP